MTAFFAFLHHVAAFALVATLAVEFVLMRGELTAKCARRLQLTDSVYGASAVLVLVVGLSRVFYFEKGASYYFYSAPFLAKLTLFIVVGLLSISPTVEFLSWRNAVARGSAPTVTPEKMATIRSILHWELIGIVLILLCAALMARGVGYFGS